MATLMLHDTKDLKMVASRLGHASDMPVLRTYGHLLPGTDRDAADRFALVVRRRRADAGGQPAVRPADEPPRSSDAT